MDRRTFIEGFFAALTFGGILVLGGCGKQEKVEGFGNEEKFWDLANGREKPEEPLESVYAKKTPALYRDASMGKADPSFVPRVSGG
jgi:hypothetical protein